MTSDISIIVPTLNEEPNLRALQSAAAMASELIIVDGGSTDKTRETASALGFSILYEPSGRGAQLNLGASRAKGDILLFLHADTILPPDFHHAINKCLLDSRTIIGAFSLRTETHGFLMNLICRCANLRSRYLQLPYGDQALFMRSKDFHALGGFPRITVMEDYVFVKTARKSGRIKTLEQEVITSARRWQRLGPIRTTCINQMMIIGYKAGVSPDRLALLYRRWSFLGKLGRNKRPDTVS